MSDGHRRFEAIERERRARAQAHLERARSRDLASVVWPKRRPEPRPHRPLHDPRSEGGWPFTATLVLLASLLAGNAVGDDWLRSAGARIERIAVRGAGRLAPETIAAATGLAPGEALRAVDAQAVVDRLEDHDWIAAARALVLPGGAVVVSVRERRPLASVPAGQPPAPHVVDADGTPFAPADAETAARLPRLAPGGAVTPRQPSEGLARAVALAARLPEYGLTTPAEIGVPADDDPRGFTLRFEGLAARFVLGREDPEARLAQLAQLVAERPSEVASAASVDLRFRDQVVLQEEPTR